MGLLSALLAHWSLPLRDALLRVLPPMGDRVFFIVATMLIHETIYYGMNGLLLFFDARGIFAKYKIERKPSQLPSSALIMRTLKQSIVGHWVVQPISLWVLFPVFQRFGSTLVDGLPSLSTCVVQVTLSVLINDAIFYWSHRLLHHPSLYARVHKQHHEYKGTVGFAAEYAHPLEQFLSNQMPSVLGPLLFGMHVWLWCVYLCWRLWRTYEVHSGYCFKGTLLSSLGLLHAWGAEYHDFHHTHNDGNFGGPGNALWDHLMGSEDAFLRFKTQQQQEGKAG